MKIISSNVNGIRAAINKGLLIWLKAANPDILCLQEIKAEKEQLDMEVFEAAGYPYNYWFPAQKKPGFPNLRRSRSERLSSGHCTEAEEYLPELILQNHPEDS